MEMDPAIQTIKCRVEERKSLRLEETIFYGGKSSQDNK